jgi:hypothetical protein
MLEARITERRKFSLKIIRGNGPNVEWLWKRENRGREFVKLRGFASKFSASHPQTRFELAQIGL